ncbi:MAG TPA: glycoside hydrolase family 3 N-terminal domain-containing protein [Gemmatimonadales bacterium]|nr:glycoside hydrolase family 3 N-terminal domain-containing protein [Gemmatimonadales bacterium]
MSLAHLVLPALRWREDAGGYAMDGGTLERALAFGVGGFILFGGTAEAAARLTRELRERAGRPLLIGADLERGAGQQFAGLSEWPPPAALATLGLEAVRAAAAATAREAVQVGVNWAFAPVADLDAEPANPIVQTRSFGADPALVAQCVTEWVGAAQAEGALACVKHFPGHGRTRQDSHREVPTVDASREALEADLAPFRAGIAAGVAGVMTAHVRYPALDPSGRPATASAAILRLLRHELGFHGLVVTDALIMDAAAGAGGPADQVAAGVDLLLYPPDLGATVTALEAGLLDGSLPEGRAVAALHRYETALARLEESRVASDGSRGTPAHAEAAAVADRLLAAPPLRGEVPRLRFPVELVVVDDDVGGPYPASPSTHVAEALGVGAGGSRVVLAFCEPRGWKGRPGFGETTRAELARHAPSADAVVLFGHPRLLAEIPGAAPVILAWHRQRPMQEAVARRLAGLRS